ncbi:unnamed protein product [Schistosoma rodhaini]|nr:unnamed protein product [Schistosoma rodhaini]
MAAILFVFSSIVMLELTVIVHFGCELEHFPRTGNTLCYKGLNYYLLNGFSLGLSRKDRITLIFGAFGNFLIFLINFSIYCNLDRSLWGKLLVEQLSGIICLGKIVPLYL